VIEEEEWRKVGLREHDVEKMPFEYFDIVLCSVIIDNDEVQSYDNVLGSAYCGCMFMVKCLSDLTKKNHCWPFTEQDSCRKKCKRLGADR